MDRQSFNPWAVELTPGDFSCALATLGILAGGEPGFSRWVNNADSLSKRLLKIRENSNGILRWAPPKLPLPPSFDKDRPTAHSAAEAWKKFISQCFFHRIEVAANAPHPIWVTEQLARPEVEATSVYIAKDQLFPDARWHWPLRIGFLPDRESKQLASTIRKMGTHLWAHELLTLIEIDRHSQQCDVLLVPYGIRRTLSRILDLVPSVRASCVIAVGAMERADQTPNLITTLEKDVRTNAIALVHIEPSLIVEWFVNRLLRNISHNWDFDVALARSLKQWTYPEDEGSHVLTSYVLTANRQWLEETQMSRMTDTLLERLSHLEISNEMIEIHPRLAFRLHIPPGLQPINQIRGFATGYLRESSDATTLAMLNKAVADVLRMKPLLPSQRRVQAQVYCQEDLHNARTTFLAGVMHQIDIRLGVEDETHISSPIAFPEENLPPSKSGHELTVVFTEPTFAPVPQVASITLPPEGASSRCSFHMKSGHAGDRVQAIISLLYRNRVLQTLVLEGQTVGEKNEVSAKPISFVPIVVVNAGMADLDRQPPIDAALLLNRTDAGVTQILKMVDDDAEMISTGDLQGYVQNIEDRLKQSDWGDETFRTLDASGTLALLRFLARHGSLMYQEVRSQFNESSRLASATSLQMIAAKPGIRLPIEYFYDLPSPTEDAQLCPESLKAIPTGKCSEACRFRANAKQYVCPLGFWGLNRVLEWHVYRPEARRELLHADYALQVGKIAQRGQLPRLDKAIVGASDRANEVVKTSVSSLLTAMQNYKVKATEIHTWEEWKQHVASTSPALLVLIPHTEIDKESKIPKLEIGNKEWLSLDQITQAYIRTDSPQPVLLLLGCDTANQDVTFETFISRFVNSGVAVIVASNTRILGRQATVLAEEFISVLNGMRPGTTFGEAVLTVRRNLLCKGYPMVLSISSYGDADWRL